MKIIFTAVFSVLISILLIYKITGFLLISNVKIDKVRLSFEPIDLRKNSNEKPR